MATLLFFFFFFIGKATLLLWNSIQEEDLDAFKLYGLANLFIFFQPPRNGPATSALLFLCAYRTCPQFSE